MHRWGRVTTIGGLSAVLALVGFSPPASAADPVRSVKVQKDESIVVIEGLTAGDPVTVEVRRNGIQIGTAAGVAPLDGMFELNHEIGDDTEIAQCWTGSTPDILGGDVVSVSSGGVSEEIVVTDIDVTLEPTKVDADTGVVRGRIAADPLPPINQLSVTTNGRTALDQRFDGIAPGTSGGVTGRLRYTAPGRFKATFDGLSRLQMGAFLDSTDVNAIHESAESVAGLSHSTVATYAADARFTEDLCPPVARRAVIGTSQGAINRANVDRPLRVWGVSANATGVQVGVEDRNGRQRTWPATITGSGTGQTWSVTYPAGGLRGLADGTLTFSAEYTEGTSVLAGGIRTIRKDTVAPQGPRIRPRGGTFLGRATVRLGSRGAHEIWYTLNGTQPRPNRAAEYHGPFSLTRSATLRAIAFDRAGNSSPVTTARFRRAGTPAAPRIGAAGSGSPGGVATATARWRPRADTGGMRITGFAVTALQMADGQVASRRTFVRPAWARSFAPQLLRNAHIRFQVRTITSAGRSAPSALSNRVTAR